MSRFMIDYLKQACTSTPENTAFMCGEESICYRELDDFSEKIALGLKQLGANQGENIAIYMDKSVPAIASIYAILKLDCCYVPISLESPEPRIAAILENCAIRYLLIDSKPDQSIQTYCQNAGIHLVSTKRLLDTVELDGQSQIVRAEISGEQPAAILHTSGSTGVPKGAVITQQNLAVFVSWATSAFNLTAMDKLLSHAPLQFDLSFFDLFSAVAASATVVVANKADTANAARMARLVNHAGITIWQSVPSALTLQVISQSAHKHLQPMPGIRCVLFAGERMPRQTLLSLSEHFPNACFFNIYGCTETNNTFIYQLPNQVAKAPDPLPIGKVLPHIQYRIIDQSGIDVAPGKKGHLLVAGETVMAGYIGLDKTGKTIYRNDQCIHGFYQTNDLVSADAKGTVYFHGRLDNVIKSNGYRINLMEIEDHLRQSQKFIDVAVLCEPDVLIGNRIIAVLTPKVKESCSILDLKIYCAKSLPKYAIPHQFYFSDKALPKGNTGKIDKRRVQQVVSSAN